jgi:hypothetical protein
MADVMGVMLANGVEWALATRPFPGETASGDRATVCEVPSGIVCAVIDGLGHGAEAALAAEAALDEVLSHAHTGAEHVVRRCHQRLVATRGVVMGVAHVRSDDRTVEWLAVGDAEMVLFHASRGVGHHRERVISRGGVVGYRLPKLDPMVVKHDPGDVLVLTTDGIDSRYVDHIDLRLPVSEIADAILAGWGRSTDDSLALVARTRSADSQ